MAAPLLQVRALHAGYGATQVLHGLDFDIEEGTITALLGANGAEQRGDGPFLDVEVQPVQHLGRAVAGVQRAHLQQRRRHQASAPR